MAKSDKQQKPAATGWRRHLTFRRVLLGVLVLVLVVVLGVALWLKGVADATWDADIATLVPADMAVVLELRNLNATDPRGRSAELAEFAKALFDDPAWAGTARSETARGLLGPLVGVEEGQVRRIDTWISESLDKLRETRIPVGDSLFGPLAPEEDLFGGSAVLALRNLDGQKPQQRRQPLPEDAASVGAGEDGEDSEGRRGRLETEYPPAAWMLNLHVGGRIKVYYALAGMAAGFLPSRIVLESFPEGHRKLTTRSKGREIGMVIWLALHGDVLTVTNSEALIGEVIELGRAQGRGGNSLFESDVYGEALNAAVQALRDSGARDPENDLGSATGRLFTNFDRLRLLGDVDSVFDGLVGGGNLQRTKAGEAMAGVLAPALETIVDAGSLRLGMSLLRLTKDVATGPTLQLDTSLLYHPGRMPGVLIQTLKDGGPDSRMLNLAGNTAWAGVSVGKDLAELAEHIGQAMPEDRTSLTLDLLKTLTGPGLVSDELLLIADRQDMSNRREDDGNQPLLVIGMRLTPAGAALAGRDPEELCGIAMSTMLKPRRRDGTDPGREAPQNRRLIPEQHSRHTVYRAFLPDDPQNPDTSNANNALVEVLRPIFGPQVSLGMCTLLFNDAPDDGYLLVGTNIDFLSGCLAAWDQGRSRFSRLGGIGVAEAYFGRGPAVCTALIDFNEYVGGRTEQAIRTAADEMFYQTTPPTSIRRRLREQAQERARGNRTVENRIYQELADEWVQEHVVKGKREYIASQLDWNHFIGIARWAGFRLTAPGEAGDRCHVRLVTSFGS